MPRGHAAVDEKNLREPTAFETVAETWLATIAPATAADVNTFPDARRPICRSRRDARARDRHQTPA